VSEKSINDLTQSIGKLTGLIEASREDIRILNDKQYSQNTILEKTTTDIAVIQNNFATKSASDIKRFEELSDKAARDYNRINNLEKKQNVANGVETYKDKKRIYLQWALGIIGTIILILISLNQLVDLARKITAGNATAISVQTVVRDTVVKHDTLKVKK
jgi:hypothetical protein